MNLARLLMTSVHHVGHPVARHPRPWNSVGLITRCCDSHTPIQSALHLSRYFEAVCVELLQQWPVALSPQDLCATVILALVRPATKHTVHSPLHQLLSRLAKSPLSRR